MVDVSVQQVLVGQAGVAQAGRFSARASWALVAACFLVMGTFFYRNEWPIGNFAYTTATTVAIVAFLAILTGRVLFSTVLTAGIVLTVILAARVKLKFLDMLVHAYDLFFYFNSFSTFAYLADAYPLAHLRTLRHAGGHNGVQRTDLSLRWGAGSGARLRRRYSFSPAWWPGPGWRAQASAGTCTSTTPTAFSPRSTVPGQRPCRRYGRGNCWKAAQRAPGLPFGVSALASRRDTSPTSS